MKMLDTNICIYTIKKKPGSVLERFKKEIISGMNLCVSVITLAELQYGVMKSSYPEKNAAALAQFMTALNVLPFGTSAAIEYGKVCAYLNGKGTPIDTMGTLDISNK